MASLLTVCITQVMYVQVLWVCKQRWRDHGAGQLHHPLTLGPGAPRDRLLLGGEAAQLRALPAEGAALPGRPPQEHALLCPWQGVPPFCSLHSPCITSVAYLHAIYQQQNSNLDLAVLNDASWDLVT